MGDDGLSLSALDGPSIGAEVPLAAESLTLGRDLACAIAIGGEQPQVSRRHAVITVDASGARISDLGSRNGTFVNGRRVETAYLSPGDEIRLGADGPRFAVRGPATDSASSLPERTGDLPVPPSFADGALYDPLRPKRPRNSIGGVLLVLTMIGAGGFLGALTILLSFFAMPLPAAVGGAFVAFAPAPFYLLIWLWIDRYDPEPAWILAGVFLWGAGAATFLSGIVNSLSEAAVAGATGNKELAGLLAASLSAPVIEEATKGLAVLLVFLILRREFDGVVDGIAYAGVVALGFAAVENVLYYGKQAAEAGMGGLVFLFLLRGCLGPFSHALFTSMTGIGCGLARQSHNGFVRFVAPLLGYAGAVFLHSAWNTLAAFSGGLRGYLVIYAVVWLPLFLLFGVFALWLGFRESRLIRAMLQPEIATGLLTAGQVERVASWPGRVGWMLGALFDPSLLGARRRFLHAAARLALSYWHVERAMRAGGQTASLGMIGSFRSEIESLRGRV